MEIIPAIIGNDFEEVKEKIEKVKELVNWIQLDVVDGVFAEPVSWGNAISRNLDLWELVDLPKIEMHLMVKNPQKMIDDWISASVDRILIHIESKGNVKEILKYIKDHKVEAGIVLNMDTKISEVEKYKGIIDVVQLMSIDTLGSYGASFNEKIYEKIKSLRSVNPNVTINIDGGVSISNAKKLVEAGADNLVIGSAIFKVDNIKNSIEEFKKII